MFPQLIIIIIVDTNLLFERAQFDYRSNRSLGRILLSRGQFKCEGGLHLGFMDLYICLLLIK